MVKRWAQELLRYTFAVLHGLNLMLWGVDSLSRQYVKLIIAHLFISNILHDQDKWHLQQACQQNDFIYSQNQKLTLKVLIF